MNSKEEKNVLDQILLYLYSNHMADQVLNQRILKKTNEDDPQVVGCCREQTENISLPSWISQNMVQVHP